MTIPPQDPRCGEQSLVANCDPCFRDAVRNATASVAVKKVLVETVCNVRQMVLRSQLV